VIGVAGALASTRVLAGMLFGTQPTDPATFVAAMMALAATAFLAAWIPARRAARIDPVAALRAE
jgi:ABC-type antimicrobial peptide transport system permease subunit